MSDLVKIVDDYLPFDDYKLIYDYFMGNMDRGDIANSCVWIYVSGIGTPNDGYSQMVQQIFLDHTIISPAFQFLKPILKKEDIMGLIRIKANLLIRTEDIVVFDHAYHSDLGDDRNDGVITSIYYVNSNNGYTLFEDGTKVESIGNRFVTFPCNMKHTGTTCSDEDRRIVVNFNYYKK